MRISDWSSDVCSSDLRQMAPFLYTGVQLVHPRVFEGTPEGPFSFNLVWDAVQESDRLYGVVHDGLWLDAGPPARLEPARAEMGEAGQGRLFGPPGCARRAPSTTFQIGRAAWRE